MENDVLKNNIAPWQEKGQWYHVHFTENGIDTANTDKFINDNVPFASQFLFVPAKYCVLDYVIKFNKYTRSGNSSFVKTLGIESSGKTSVLIPAPATYTELDIDIYIYICKYSN